MIAEALKPDFLFGKMRLPQRSFIPLVIPKENDPETLIDMGSGPDSIQDLALESSLKSLLPTENQPRSQKSEQELKSYFVKVLLKSRYFKDHLEELTSGAVSPSLLLIKEWAKFQSLW